MEKKIISVGFKIPADEESFYSFSSSQSLLDGDIVIFSPNLEDYWAKEEYNGKPCYSQDYSFRIDKQSQHWKKEIGDALKDGKNVFVMIDKYEEFYIYTGQTRESGSGRNTRVTNLVTDYDNFKSIPIELPTIISKTGKRIKFTGEPIFSEFWKEYGSNLEYKLYFDGLLQNNFLQTWSGEKSVGGYISVGKGNLILLPMINITDPEFTESKEDGDYWSKKGEAFGKRFIKIIVDIDRDIKSLNKKSITPEWAKTDLYLTQKEKDIVKQIGINKEKQDELVKESAKLQEELEEAEVIKGLLFETGHNLEASIAASLKVLGYEVENYKDDTSEFDQVMLSPEGERFIGEAEGKDNSNVNIDKYRQLSLNIQEDLKKEDTKLPASAILFGNSFRLLDPEVRKEKGESFTKKCLDSAKTFNTILISTPDLFTVVKYIKDTGNTVFATNCRESISKGKGGIVIFPKLPKE